MEGAEACGGAAVVGAAVVEAEGGEVGAGVDVD